MADFEKADSNIHFPISSYDFELMFTDLECRSRLPDGICILS